MSVSKYGNIMNSLIKVVVRVTPGFTLKQEKELNYIRTKGILLLQFNKCAYL